MRKVVLVLGALVVSLVAGVALYWYWVPLHRGSDVARDRALLARVGAPPGAVVVSESVESYGPENDSWIGAWTGPVRTIGYRVNVRYALPKPTPVERVLAYYAPRLDGFVDIDASATDSFQPRLHWYLSGWQSFQLDPGEGQIVNGDTKPDISGFSVRVDAHDAQLPCAAGADGLVCPMSR